MRGVARMDQPPPNPNTVANACVLGPRLAGLHVAIPLRSSYRRNE